MTVYEERFYETIIRELPKFTKELEKINTNLENINSNLENMDGIHDNGCDIVEQCDNINKTISALTDVMNAR